MENGKFSFMSCAVLSGQSGICGVVKFSTVEAIMSRNVVHYPENVEVDGILLKLAQNFL